MDLKGFVPADQIIKNSDKILSNLCPGEKFVSFISVSFTETIVIVFADEPVQEWFDILAETKTLSLEARWNVFSLLNRMTTIPSVRVAPTIFAYFVTIKDSLVNNFGYFFPVLSLSLFWVGFVDLVPFLVALQLSMLFELLYRRWFVFPMKRENADKAAVLYDKISALIAQPWTS